MFNKMRFDEFIAKNLFTWEEQKMNGRNEYGWVKAKVMKDLPFSIYCVSG